MNDWAENADSKILTTQHGSTTFSRAKKYGSYTGKIIESAYFYNTYSIDAIDMMRFIITNDGHANNIRDALFLAPSTYTLMGAAYAVENGCTMNTVLTDDISNVNEIDFTSAPRRTYSSVASGTTA